MTDLSRRSVGDAQPPLPGFTLPARPAGPIETATVTSLETAFGRGLIDDIDSGLAAALQAASRQLDAASNPYAAAAVLREITGLYEALGLLPAQRRAKTVDVADLLAGAGDDDDLDADAG